MSSARLVLIERHSIGRDVFYTTPLFWDCECEEDYIHDCTCEDCPACGSTQAESPDARVDEVLQHTRSLNEGLIALLERLCERVCPNLNSIPF